MIVGTIWYEYDLSIQPKGIVKNIKINKRVNQHTLSLSVYLLWLLDQSQINVTLLLYHEANNSMG